MILYGEDPLAFYLRQLDSISPLIREEESALVQHVRSNDELSESAAQRLIEANLKLVVSIAERHLSSGTAMLDLVQEGNGGLLLALEDFSKDSGANFSTYASSYIERAILKAIDDSGMRHK
jgi:RNA polymerase primary sigma factor